ncbi:hypothetical protein GUITHDRAFT_117682 [Guillardia theta CCMP2712]|uniref:Uncharacterized protein n=1 Tax=Guillardia theta (strain CCMP2712) TaxID=905079 RepID=L1IJQ8_GUITC|nr:hypothetical protein GUITHDRAFT_117682 [Guillardia theta CCMP2712]EKX36164.1 hypothetical protein GUITHDRAFT_117682 [Guillardia theta CCMP2712]|eukprot:XP_005823144.1 hypothetical protein GUITHDRAFT_117682 [Guillardia theta CCMP2712]
MHGAVNHLPSGSHPEEAIDYDGVQVVFHSASIPNNDCHSHETPTPSKEEIEQETMDLLHESLEQLAEWSELADRDDGVLRFPPSVLRAAGIQDDGLWDEAYYDDEREFYNDDLGDGSMHVTPRYDYSSDDEPGSDHEEMSESGHEFSPEIGAPGEGAAGNWKDVAEKKKKDNTPIFIKRLKDYQILPNYIKDAMTSLKSFQINHEIDKLMEKCDTLKRRYTKPLGGKFKNIYYSEFLSMTRKLNFVIRRMSYLLRHVNNLEKGKVTDRDEYQKNINTARNELKDTYNVMRYVSLILFANKNGRDEFIKLMKSEYKDEERKESVMKHFKLPIWEKPQGDLHHIAREILTEEQINSHNIYYKRMYLRHDYEKNRHEIDVLKNTLDEMDEIDKSMDASDDFKQFIEDNSEHIATIKVITSIRYMLQWAKIDHVFVEGFNDKIDYSILEDIVRGNPIGAIPKDEAELKQALNMHQSTYNQYIKDLDTNADKEIQRDIQRMKSKEPWNQGEFQKNNKEDFNITPQYMFAAMIKGKQKYADTTDIKDIKLDIQSRNDRRVKKILKQVHGAYAGNVERLRFCKRYTHKVYNMWMKATMTSSSLDIDPYRVNIREIKQELYDMKPYMADVQPGHMKRFGSNLLNAINVKRIMKQQMQLDAHKDVWNTKVNNAKPTDDYGMIIRNSEAVKLFKEALPLILAARINTIKALNVILMPSIKNNDQDANSKKVFQRYMLGMIDALLGQSSIEVPLEYQRGYGEYRLEPNEYMMNDIKTTVEPDSFTFKQMEQLKDYLHLELPTVKTWLSVHEFNVNAEQNNDIMNVLVRAPGYIDDIKSTIQTIYEFTKLMVLYQFGKWIDRNIETFTQMDNRVINENIIKENIKSYQSSKQELQKNHRNVLEKLKLMTKVVSALNKKDWSALSSNEINENDREKLKQELNKETKLIEKIIQHRHNPIQQKNPFQRTIPLMSDKNKRTDQDSSRSSKKPRLECIFSRDIHRDIEDPNGILLGDAWGYAAEMGESDSDSEDECDDQKGVSAMFIGMPVAVTNNAKRRRNRKNKDLQPRRRYNSEIMRYRSAVSRLNGLLLQLKISLDQSTTNLHNIEKHGIDRVIENRKKFMSKITEVSNTTRYRDTSPKSTLIELYNFAVGKQNETAKQAIVKYIMGCKMVISVVMQRVLKILVIQSVNYQHSAKQFKECSLHLNPKVKKLTTSLYINTRRLIKEDDPLKIVRLMPYVINSFVEIIKGIYYDYRKKLRITLQQEAILSFILHNQTFLNPFTRMTVQTTNMDTTNLMNIVTNFEHMIQVILAGEDDKAADLEIARLPGAAENDKPMLTWSMRSWDDFYVTLTNAPLTEVIDKLTPMSGITKYPRLDGTLRENSLGIIKDVAKKQQVSTDHMETVMKNHWEDTKKKIIDKLNEIFTMDYQFTYKTALGTAIVPPNNILNSLVSQLKETWRIYKDIDSELKKYAYLKDITNGILLQMSTIEINASQLKMNDVDSFINLRAMLSLYTNALYNMELAYQKGRIQSIDLSPHSPTYSPPSPTYSPPSPTYSPPSPTYSPPSPTYSPSSPTPMHAKLGADGDGMEDNASEKDNESEPDMEPEEPDMEPDNRHHTQMDNDPGVRKAHDQRGIGGKNTDEDSKASNVRKHSPGVLPGFVRKEEASNSPKPSRDQEIDHEKVWNPPHTRGGHNRGGLLYEDPEASNKRPRSPSPAHSHPSSTTSVSSATPWKVHIIGILHTLPKEDFTRILHIHLDRDSVVKYRLKQVLPKLAYNQLYVTRSRVARNMQVVKYSSGSATIVVSGKVFAEILKKSIENMKNNHKTELFGDNTPEVSIEESNWDGVLHRWVFRYIRALHKFTLNMAYVIKSLKTNETAKAKNKKSSYYMQRTSDTWYTIVSHRLRHTELWTPVSFFDHLSADMYFPWYCIENLPGNSLEDIVVQFQNFYSSNLINAAYTAITYNPDNYEIGRKPPTDGNYDLIDMYGSFRERDMRKQIRKGLQEKKKAWNELMIKWKPDGINAPWPFTPTVNKLLNHTRQSDYNKESYELILKSSNLIDAPQ